MILIELRKSKGIYFGIWSFRCYRTSILLRAGRVNGDFQAFAITDTKNFWNGWLDLGGAREGHQITHKASSFCLGWQKQEIWASAARFSGRKSQCSPATYVELSLKGTKLWKKRTVWQQQIDFVGHPILDLERLEQVHLSLLNLRLHLFSLVLLLSQHYSVPFLCQTPSLPPYHVQYFLLSQHSAKQSTPNT